MDCLPQQLRSHDLALRFSDRILPIDHQVADRWGRIAGSAAARKSPLPVIDGLFAATAPISRPRASVLRPHSANRPPGCRSLGANCWKRGGEEITAPRD